MTLQMEAPTRVNLNNGRRSTTAVRLHYIEDDKKRNQAGTTAIQSQSIEQIVAFSIKILIYRRLSEPEPNIVIESG